MSVGKGFQKAPIMTPRKSQKEQLDQILERCDAFGTVRRNFTVHLCGQLQWAAFTLFTSDRRTSTARVSLLRPIFDRVTKGLIARLKVCGRAFVTRNDAKIRSTFGGGTASKLHLPALPVRSKQRNASRRTDFLPALSSVSLVVAFFRHSELNMRR
jgi:hypothetical protein